MPTGIRRIPSGYGNALSPCQNQRHRPQRNQIMPKFIYRNREGALTLPGGWTWTTEPNAASDEYAGEENVLGLFAGGWCIIGVQAGRSEHGKAAYRVVRVADPRRAGSSLLNHFVGFWQ